MTEFPQRQIGRTALRVTELGLGCATLDAFDVTNRYRQWQTLTGTYGHTIFFGVYETPVQSRSRKRTAIERMPTLPGSRIRTRLVVR